MKLKKKKIVLAVLFLVIAIQFIPVKQNNGREQSAFIGNQFPVNAEVKSVLQKACMDCHSNVTEYPWYANVQPFAWYLANHVNDGKRHLNFDAFLHYRPYKQFHKLEEIDEVLLEGEMPLWDYSLLHPKAKLSEDDKHLLIEWSKQMRDSMQTWYPQDSLERPKK